MAFPVVDIHPHVISPDTARYPRDPLGGHQSAWSRDRPTTYEQLVAAMDRAGVAKAALVQAATCYGFDNSYVADAVAAHPERFTGVFSVDVLAPDAREKIRYWRGRGLTGLRLFTAGSTMPDQAGWIDDPRSFSAWQCCAELGIPVCMQMQQAGIPQLEAMLARFPTVSVIIDHMAKPPIEDGPPYAGAAPVLSLATYGSVFLKLTTTSVRAAAKGKARPESFFRTVVERYGASRIAWGSNYPASEGTLEAMVGEARAALSFLSAEEQDWVFRGTARKLYPALASS